MTVRIRQSSEIAQEPQDIATEADVLVVEIPDISPLDLARELMAKRETCDMDGATVPLVAQVLSGRQPEWLKGRQWSAAAPILGRPELQRTDEHAQHAAPDDIDDRVFTRET